MRTVFAADLIDFVIRTICRAARGAWRKGVTYRPYFILHRSLKRGTKRVTLLLICAVAIMRLTEIQSVRGDDSMQNVNAGPSNAKQLDIAFTAA